MQTKREGYDCNCLEKSGRNELGYRMPHRLLTTLGGAISPGWWDPNGEGLCVWAAYQPIGAANFAASLIDLSGNGNDAVDPGGAATPAWNAVNGWIGDGIADYLTTTFVAAGDASQSALCRFAGVGTPNAAIFGSNDAGNADFRILPSTAAQVLYGNPASLFVAPQLLTGNLGIAGNQGYRNGAPDGGAIAAGGAAASAVYILAQNTLGVAGAFMLANVQALVIYDCVLTAAQMLAVYTAMAAL